MHGIDATLRVLTVAMTLCRGAVEVHSQGHELDPVMSALWPSSCSHVAVPINKAFACLCMFACCVSLFFAQKKAHFFVLTFFFFCRFPSTHMAARNQAVCGVSLDHTPSSTDENGRCRTDPGGRGKSSSRSTVLSRLWCYPGQGKWNSGHHRLLHQA